MTNIFDTLVSEESLKKLMNHRQEKILVCETNNLSKIPSNLNPSIYNLLDEKLLLELEVRSNNLMVSTKQEACQALEMRSQADILEKQIETSRKEIVRPHLDFQKALMKIAKDLTTKLNSIKQSLESKISDFDGDKKLESDTGSMKKVEEWSYRVTDLDKVSREFLVIDEKAIKEAIKSGIRELDGIEIFKETKNKYRTKAIKGVKND